MEKQTPVVAENVFLLNPANYDFVAGKTRPLAIRAGLYVDISDSVPAHRHWPAGIAGALGNRALERKSRVICVRSCRAKGIWMATIRSGFITAFTRRMGAGRYQENHFDPQRPEEPAAAGTGHAAGDCVL